MSGERNRQKNFSDQECLELIRTVQKYAHIIECKETGKYKNEQKAAAWDAVCRDYNRRTSYVRHIKCHHKVFRLIVIVVCFAGSVDDKFTNKVDKR